MAPSELGVGSGIDEWLVSAPARTSLASLDAALKDAARTGCADIEAAATDLVERPGKRIRPALVFLAAEFGTGDPLELRTAATAVELLHVGSLYHDDIMDRAQVRRGAPAVATRFGESVAAAAGTYLVARAIELLTTLGDEANRLMGDALLELCTGQLREAENAYNLDLPLEEHLTILAGKTATLFELPCRLGAALARVPEDELTALVSFARHIGVAFQLADDALDLSGDAAAMGKETGTDVREGAYSLPILFAAQPGVAVADELRTRLAKIEMSDAEVRAVVRLVRESEAVEEALKVADTHAGRAARALERLPESPAKESLSRLATRAARRSR